MARATQRGPVTAKVCVLAKALRNTQFVKSAALDPQKNQALRPSFPRAPGGEVSRDPIDVRSTVRPQQRASCSYIWPSWPMAILHTFAVTGPICHEDQA